MKRIGDVTIGGHVNNGWGQGQDTSEDDLDNEPLSKSEMRPLTAEEPTRPGGQIPTTMDRTKLYSYLSTSDDDIANHNGQRSSNCRFRSPTTGSHHGEGAIRRNIDGVSEAELRRFSIMRGENPYADINEIDVSQTPPPPQIPPPVPPPPMDDRHRIPRRSAQMQGQMGIAAQPAVYGPLNSSMDRSPMSQQRTIDRNQDERAHLETQHSFLRQTPTGGVYVPPADPDCLPYPHPATLGTLSQPLPWSGDSDNGIADDGSRGFAAGCAAAGAAQTLLSNDRRQSSHLPPSYGANVPLTKSENGQFEQHGQPEVTDNCQQRPPYHFSTGTHSAQSSFDLKRRNRGFKENCSWRRLALLLTLVTAFLILLLLYFTIMKSGNLNWRFRPNSHSTSLFSSVQPIPYTLPSTAKHTIDAHEFWLISFKLKNDQFVKINLTIPDSSIVAIFLRKYARPSLARYDHYKVVNGQTLSKRLRRSIEYTTEKHDTAFRVYLEKGDWFMQLYNDDKNKNEIKLNIKQDDTSETSCSMDCFARGKCVNGKCKCFPGHWGYDCSKDECPVLCRGHGIYIRGTCKCHEGWKGDECSKRLTECEDPDCLGNGKCIDGECECSPGFKGESCQQVTCLVANCSMNGVCDDVNNKCKCFHGYTGVSCDLDIPKESAKELRCKMCSEHGVYKDNKCVCDVGWIGADCSHERCTKNCNNGDCSGQRCICKEGWTGESCQKKACDTRCDVKRASCVNGTCVCKRGWNGIHCTIDACPNNCNHHGNCEPYYIGGNYACYCKESWKGIDCSVAIEQKCNDRLDNDNDGLIDCLDPNCCASIDCNDSPYCKNTVNPAEFILSLKLFLPTSSFFDLTRFMTVQDSVQSNAVMSTYDPKRASVIHGRVYTEDGTPVTSVKITVARQSMYGKTYSREQGSFDILVNGGGSIELIFSRKPFLEQVAIIYVPWNRFVNMPTIILRTNKEKNETKTKISYRCLNIHNYNSNLPNIISPWRHTQKSVCPKSNQVMIESQVLQERIPIEDTNINVVFQSSKSDGYHSLIFIQLIGTEIPEYLTSLSLNIYIEGMEIHKELEAEENLSYTFSWDKKNVFKQLVFGVVDVKVTVNYLYEGCDNIFHITKSAKMVGYDIGSTEIGGWNIDIHHSYSNEHGVLYMGDGTNFYIKQQSLKVAKILGHDGKPRSVMCSCNGLTNSTLGRMKYASSIASGTDGSLYVADWNFIRKVSNNNTKVISILMMSKDSLGYKYAMAISPRNGRLYITDPANNRIIRVTTMGQVADISRNYQTIAGLKGRMCSPSSNHKSCGDGGYATDASLLYPSAITIDKDGTIYFSDTSNIRYINSVGKIATLIGTNSQNPLWTPMPCDRPIKLRDVKLSNPKDLAINTMDNSLYILDQDVIFKVTAERTLIKVLGDYPYCNNSQTKNSKGSAQLKIESVISITLSNTGDLYFIENDRKKINRVKVLTNDGELNLIAGKETSLCDCGRDCKCIESSQAILSTNLVLDSPMGLIISPNNALYISDTGNNRILKISHRLPERSLSQYKIDFPKTGESYIFDRNGKHTKTLNLLTGEILYEFSYNRITGVKKLISIRDSIGKNVTLRYDLTGQITNLTTFRGYTMKFVKIGSNLLKNYTDSNGAYSRFYYNKISQMLISKESSDGQRIFYEYDSNGRLEKIIPETGISMTLDRKIDNNILSVKVRNGKEFHETIQTLNNLVTLGEGKRKRIIHEDNYNLKVQFPANMTLSFRTQELSSKSNQKEILMTREIRVNDHKNIVEWSLKLRSEDGSGGRSYRNTQSYSRRLSVRPVAHPSGESYARSTRVSQTPATWKTLSINGVELLKVVYNPSTRIEYVFNEKKMKILQIHYNRANQPIQFVPMYNNLPSIKIQRLDLSYNSHGEMTEWKRGNEIVTFDYKTIRNSHSVLIKSSNYLLGIYDFEYSQNSSMQIKKINSITGASYEFNNDENGNLMSIKATPAVLYHHFEKSSLFGLVEISYKRDSSVYSQLFNSLGRLKEIRYPSFNENVPDNRKVIYEYTKDGRLEFLKFNHSTINYMYSEEGELLIADLSEWRSTLNNSFLCTLTYDTSKLVTKHSVYYTDSSLLISARYSYTYDDNLLVTSVVTSFMKDHVLFKTLIMETTYETMGQKDTIGRFKFSTKLVQDRMVRVEKIQDNNFEFTKDYDNLGRISILRSRSQKKGIYTMKIKYDKFTGRIKTTLAKTLEGVYNITYLYDNASRLIEQREFISATRQQLNYKLVWNKQSHIIQIINPDKSIMKFPTNSQGQLTSKDYKYDKDGFLVKRHERTYIYNARGLLVESIANSKSVFYNYDAERRLVVIDNDDDLVVQYFYSDIKRPRLLTHSCRNGNEITEYYYDTQDRLFSLSRYIHGSVSHYYLTMDTNNSPYIIFNKSGRPILRIKYNPLGKTRIDGKEKDIFYFDIGFNSMIVDPIDPSLLHNTDGRVFDTDTGRWTSLNYDKILNTVKNGDVYKDPNILEGYQKRDLISINIWKPMLDINDWLHELYGYDIPSLISEISFSGAIGHKKSRDTRFSSIVASSAYECSFDRRMSLTHRLSLLPPSKLSTQTPNKVSFSVGRYSLLSGVTIGVSRQRVHVYSGDDYENANPRVVESIRTIFNDTDIVALERQIENVVHFVSRKSTPENIDRSILQAAGIKMTVDDSDRSIRLTGAGDTYTIKYAVKVDQS